MMDEVLIADLPPTEAPVRERQKFFCDQLANFGR